MVNRCKAMQNMNVKQIYRRATFSLGMCFVILAFTQKLIKSMNLDIHLIENIVCRYPCYTHLK